MVQRARKGQGGRTLPEIAMVVKMIADGSMDGPCIEEIIFNGILLKNALDSWAPSHIHDDIGFDEGVRIMCLAAYTAFRKRWADETADANVFVASAVAACCPECGRCLRYTDPADGTLRMMSVCPRCGPDRTG